MNIDFSKIFHQSSKNYGKGHQPIPQRYEDWPDEWKTTYYKSYPRLPKIDLTDDSLSADFFELTRQRQSHRDFSRTPISKKELSLLLKYSCGNMGQLQGERKRQAK